jgi:tetrahydromethanopterin S-methyltransferase subunit B
MKQSIFKISLIAVLFLSLSFTSNSQTVPEDYKKGTISEQLNQLEARTRIYEGYRAIREDIFQLVSANIKDTLATKNKRINNLIAKTAALNSSIDSMNKSLETTKASLEEITQTKNSLSVFGIELNKTVYNSVMWLILSTLVFLLVIGYLKFKINRDATLKAKQELVGLQKEFDDYKQKKRIEHENLTMAHFNEIKKIKNESSRR